MPKNQKNRTRTARRQSSLLFVIRLFFARTSSDQQLRLALFDLLACLTFKENKDVFEKKERKQEKEREKEQRIEKERRIEINYQKLNGSS